MTLPPARLDHHCANLAQAARGWDHFAPREKLLMMREMTEHVNAIRAQSWPLYVAAKHVKGCTECQNGEPCHEGLTLLDAVNEAVR